MKLSIANLILRNTALFGHVLVARGPDDLSLAARCERCLESVEFPQLAPMEVKDRELRMFRKVHDKCAEPEEAAAQDEPLIKSVV